MMPKAAVYNLITVGLQVDSTIVYIKRSDQQTAVSNSCRNWCKLGYPYGAMTYGFRVLPPSLLGPESSVNSIWR